MNPLTKRTLLIESYPTGSQLSYPKTQEEERSTLTSLLLRLQLLLSEAYLLSGLGDRKMRNNLDKERLPNFFYDTYHIFPEKLLHGDLFDFWANKRSLQQLNHQGETMITEVERLYRNCIEQKAHPPQFPVIERTLTAWRKALSSLDELDLYQLHHFTKKFPDSPDYRELGSLFLQAIDTYRKEATQDYKTLCQDYRWGRKTITTRHYSHFDYENQYVDENFLLHWRMRLFANTDSLDNLNALKCTTFFHNRYGQYTFREIASIFVQKNQLLEALHFVDRYIKNSFDPEKVEVLRGLVQGIEKWSSTTAQSKEVRKLANIEEFVTELSTLYLNWQQNEYGSIYWQGYDHLNHFTLKTMTKIMTYLAKALEKENKEQGERLFCALQKSLSDYALFNEKKMSLKERLPFFV